MKAAVFQGNRTITLEEVPDPAPGADEVVIKILGCGVCGSDAHIYTGVVQLATPPVVLGHEIYGEIAEIGNDVKDLAVGRKVAVDPFIFCNKCYFCKRGEYRFCVSEDFVGYNHSGGFAQFVCVPQGNVFAHPGDLGLKQGILIETVSTVVAGFRKLSPSPGISALVLGAGTVGLLWAQILRHGGAGRIFQTELIPMRREVAATNGADLVISPEEDVESVVKEYHPFGVDVLVDATGSVDAIAPALPLLKPGGTFVSFGICPEEERLSLSLNWFYRNQITFITSRRPPREISRALALVEKGTIDAENLVTGVYPLEDIETAFTRFEAEKNQEIKMAIDPWI